MARAVRGNANRVSKRQGTLRSYGKVSKITTDHPDVKAKLEQVALSPVVNPKEAVKVAPKRKLSDIQDDSETEPGNAYVAAAKSKKVGESCIVNDILTDNCAQPKRQLPTPPSGQRQEEEEDSIDIEFSPPLEIRQLSLKVGSAPEEPDHSQESHPILEDFVALHASFLRAFTVHIVHNGQSAPADLDSLMKSVTGLWKRHTVTKEDIQRMLAIYELEVSDHALGRVYKHKECPFKLTMIGSETRYNVEYVGGGSSSNSANKSELPPWHERGLQNIYQSHILAAFISQRNHPESWLHGDIRKFPRLGFAVGIQTQIRKDNAATARNEILGLGISAQAVNRATHDASDAERMDTPKIVKDRTLSLLDRVRAKALANSSATPQTSEAMLRRYAVGRINEVVEILRMKQQRRLSAQFMSVVHSSPSKVRGKVSFSMNQLISEIKGSLAVPIGDAVIRTCIDILANDIPSWWLSVYTVGKVQSVILNGPGPSGVEVKKMLDDNVASK